MARDYWTEVVVDLPAPEAFQLAKKAVQLCGWRALESDRDAGVISAKAPFSMASYGHRIEVECSTGGRVAPGSVRVVIRSRSIWIQLVDWGSNQRNCEMFVRTLTRLVSEAQAARGDAGPAQMTSVTY